MAADNGRRSRSVGFYKDLNNLNTTGYFDGKARKKGKLYEVERVIYARNTNRKKEYLIRWKDCGPLTDSWEPEENLNSTALRYFFNPKPPLDIIRYGTEALGLGILKHLRSRHGNADISTTVELREDVYKYLFNGKGRQSGRRGYINMDKDDFCRCNFPNGWESSVDRLGDGVKVVFPIRMRHFLGWGPKSYILVNQTLVPSKRYHQEKLSICFATTAFAIN